MLLKGRRRTSVILRHTETETEENVKDRSDRERDTELQKKGWWGEVRREENGGRVSRRDREPLIAWREHDNWEESRGRKISSSIDQSGSSISVASNPLLRLPLHPICTRNLDWSGFVFVCVCICVYVEVILHSVCPSLCAYISFVFIYLLMCLSITCQCGGTWGIARNSAANRVDTVCVCVFMGFYFHILRVKGVSVMNYFKKSMCVKLHVVWDAEVCVYIHECVIWVCVAGDGHDGGAVGGNLPWSISSLPLEWPCASSWA